MRSEVVTPNLAYTASDIFTTVLASVVHLQVQAKKVGNQEHEERRMRYGRLRDEVNKLRDENAALAADRQVLTEQINAANNEAKAQAEQIKRSRYLSHHPGIDTHA